MRTVGSTIRWMILLLLVGGISAGGYVYYIWSESDELLTQMLHDRLEEMFPDWNIDFRQAGLYFQGRFRIRDLTLKEPDGAAPFLEIGEVIVTADRERLADPSPPVQLIHCSKARLHLRRDRHGRWNYQEFAMPKGATTTLPEIRIEHAVVIAEIERAAGGVERIQFDQVKLRLIPSGAQQFKIEWSALSPNSEGIVAKGRWKIDDGSFKLEGNLKNLIFDSALAQRAAALSPDCQSGLTRLDDWLQQQIDQEPSPQSPKGRGRNNAGAAPDADPIAKLGFRAAANVEFTLVRESPDESIDYQLSVHLLQGVMANPPAPFPLTDLRGQIEFDSEKIEFLDLSAQSGPVNFHILNGEIAAQGELRPAKFDVKITSLPLDDRLPGLLPERLRKGYRDLQPGGEADMNAHIEFDGRDNWTNECEVSFRNGSITHRLFPYHVDQVQGTMKRHRNRIEVELYGRAGLQKVTLLGSVENPGTAAKTRFEIRSTGIPIDKRLRAASPPKLQAIIDQLQAEGDLEGKVIVSREAGENRPTSVAVDLFVTNGALCCQDFPIRIEEVGGRIFGGAENWTFENFRGHAGSAEVAVDADYRRNDAGRLRLRLDYSVDGGAFDRKLYDAVPATLKNLWGEFNPEGKFGVAGRAYWRPENGGRFEMKQFRAQVRNSRMTLRSFPFSINDVSANVEFDGHKVTVDHCTGRHDDMVLRIGQGTATIDPDGAWVLRLEQVTVDDLEATPQFRRALPVKLAEVVNSMNPRGKQSIEGWIEFAGKPGGFPVTAAWNTRSIYSGTTMNAGVELRDVRGQIDFAGTWDGFNAVGDGVIDLKSVKLFNKYLLTDVKGPISLNGPRLILGAEPPEGRIRTVDPQVAQRISARFVDGRIMFDASVSLNEPLRYRVLLDLKEASLKKFAALYMNGTNRLSGMMNGAMDLSGDGSGPKNLRGIGNLSISRAALYELPLIAQIFSVLSFAPADNAAFNSARFAFRISNGRVEFDRIDLEGDAINLMGRGTVDFDGGVRLGFISRMGNKTLPIPIVHPILSATTQGWVGVDVRGTMQDLKVEKRALPQMDDAIRRLLEPRMSRR